MSFLKGHKILIVGGNGYVGNRVASRLIQHSAKVSALSRHGPRFQYPENLQIEWIIGDIMNAQRYKEKINQADTIIHTIATLLDTSITRFKQPGDIGTYEHMNRETFLSLLKVLDSKKKVILISAEGHPPFIPRYETTKMQAQEALFNSQHEGYVLRPGFIYDWKLKRWSIPLRHTIRLWNKAYGYVNYDQQSLFGKIWKQLKQSEPTSLEMIAESISVICNKGGQQKILDDKKIRQYSQKYREMGNQ